MFQRKFSFVSSHRIGLIKWEKELYRVYKQDFVACTTKANICVKLL